VATNSSKIRVAVSGEVLLGATSAAAPTGTGSATTGFTGLGYVSEDGVTETRDRTSDPIKAWQNGATVRTVVTDSGLTYTFTLLETKKEIVELFYGTTVTQAAAEGDFVVVPANTGGRKSFVLDVVDGAELLRIYIPQGEVAEVGDVVYSNGEPIGYEVTVTTYEDAGIGGNTKVWSTALKA
jgi:hypothetical protein